MENQTNNQQATQSGAQNSTNNQTATSQNNHMKPVQSTAQSAAQNHTQTSSQNGSANGTKSSSASGSAGNAPTMTSVLKQTHVPTVVCDWLTCLRKPALSMQYSLSKRHVPDLDTDQAAQTIQNGVNSDTMQVSGGFTIRYFDLAAGMLGILSACCLFKICCALKRKMF